MANNTEKTLTFEQKRTMVLRKGFKDWEIDVVETWYEIEEEDEDISTERLMAMTADSCDVDDDEVATTMCKFQEKYDRIFGDEDENI